MILRIIFAGQPRVVLYFVKAWSPCLHLPGLTKYCSMLGIQLVLAALSFAVGCFRNLFDPKTMCTCRCTETAPGSQVLWCGANLRPLSRRAFSTKHRNKCSNCRTKSSARWVDPVRTR